MLAIVVAYWRPAPVIEFPATKPATEALTIDALPTEVVPAKVTPWDVN
jgi:hypothetical protein